MRPSRLAPGGRSLAAKRSPLLYRSHAAAGAVGPTKKGLQVADPKAHRRLPPGRGTTKSAVDASPRQATLCLAAPAVSGAYANVLYQYTCREAPRQRTHPVAASPVVRSCQEALPTAHGPAHDT